MENSKSQNQGPVSGVISVLLRLCSALGILVIVVVVIALLFPAVNGGSSPKRITCSNNLKLLSIAVHEYYEEHGRFPPAYLLDEYGVPAHSWRVLILPYLEQTELYKQYDFGEPWNSPRNIQLVNQMPQAYYCPMDEEDTPSGYTHYVAVVGEATSWPLETGLAFTDIMDGTSNTILFVESNNAVPWTAPRDEDFDAFVASWSEDNPFRHPGGREVSLCDASVRFISNTLPRETLRALLTASGGEEVGNY